MSFAKEGHTVTNSISIVFNFGNGEQNITKERKLIQYDYLFFKKIIKGSEILKSNNSENLKICTKSELMTRCIHTSYLVFSQFLSFLIQCCNQWNVLDLGLHDLDPVLQRLIGLFVVLPFCEYVLELNVHVSESCCVVLPVGSKFRRFLLDRLSACWSCVFQSCLGKFLYKIDFLLAIWDSSSQLLKAK